MRVGSVQQLHHRKAAQLIDPTLGGGGGGGRGVGGSGCL